MGVVVSRRLNRGGKDMNLQIMNQVSPWALGDVIIKEMNTGKRK